MNDMKQPEALRLARELEGVYPVNIQDQEAAAAELRRLHELNDELLKAAIAAEREACAKLCDELAVLWPDEGGTPGACASDIRARGQQ